MPSEASNEIQQKIDALPQEVREYLYSADMHNAIVAIGTKHQLHIDQVGALESEVAAAMIGISPLAELSENIADTLNIEKTKSELVVKDVNEQILSKIRSSMMQTDSKTEAPKPVGAPAAIANAPAASATPAMEGKSVVMPSATKPLVTDIKPSSTQAMPPAQEPMAKPISAPVTIPVATGPKTPPVSAPKPATPPVVATVAPTTLVPPKVDAVLTQPTVSAVPKVEATPQPAPQTATPATTAAPVTPPPPPPAHKVDPYREPID